MQLAEALSVAPPVRRRLAVAVRAEHLKVLEAVIRPDSVDVIEVHEERPSSPLRQTALSAPVLEEAFVDESGLYVVPVALWRREEDLDRHRGPPGLDLAALLRLLPRAGAETEARPAFAIGMPFVVVCLHGGPVVASPAVAFLHDPIVS